MHKVFPWNHAHLEVFRFAERIGKDLDDALILRVFRQGVKAYLKTRSVETIEQVSELWYSYITKLPEKLQERARCLTSYIIYAPIQEVPRILSDMMKALLLISIPDRQLYAMGMTWMNRGREDIRLGQIKFRPNYSDNTVMLSASMRNDSIKEAFENFIRDNELQSETSKFQYIFEIIKPDTIYDKYTDAKCALWFINTFQTDFLNILTDSNVETALKVGEISLAVIIKALSDRYTYYLESYFLEKTSNLRGIEFHELISSTLTKLSGNEIIPDAFYNFKASAEAHSDMRKLVEEYVLYFKAGIRLQVSPAITALEKERKRFVYSTLVNIVDKADCYNTYPIYYEGMNIQEYISPDHDLNFRNLTAEMDDETILDSFCRSNQSFFDSFDREKSGEELYQLFKLSLWSAFVSHERCPEWVREKNTAIQARIRAENQVAINFPSKEDQRSGERSPSLEASIANSHSCLSSSPANETEVTTEFLKKFSSTYAYELKKIDETVIEHNFYKHILIDLVRKQDSSFVETCAALIGTQNDPFKPIIFDSHLKEVLTSPLVDETNRAFARAVEAVAITWRYPAILDYLYLPDRSQYAALEFKAAVDWMRIHSDYEYSIHQLYDLADEEAPWKRFDEARKNIIFVKMIPEFLRVVTPTVIAELFRKSNVKKIMPLDAGLNFIERSITAEPYWGGIGAFFNKIRRNTVADALDSVFAQFANMIVFHALENFQKIFLSCIDFQRVIQPKNILKMASISILFETFKLCEIIKVNNQGIFNSISVKMIVEVVIKKIIEELEEEDFKLENNDCYLREQVDAALKRAPINVAIKQVFLNMRQSAISNDAAFKEIFFLYNDVSRDDFVKLTEDKLLFLAQRSMLSSLDFLIKHLNRDGTNAALFSDAIRSELNLPSYSNNFKFLISFIVNIPQVIALLAEFLKSSIIHGNQERVSQLVDLLPCRAPEKVLSAVSTDSLIDNFSPRQFSSVSNTSSARQSLCEEDNDVREKSLQSFLLNNDQKENFLKILGSNLLFHFKLKLIGAIAFGKCAKQKSFFRSNSYAFYEKLKSDFCEVSSNEKAYEACNTLINKSKYGFDFQEDLYSIQVKASVQSALLNQLSSFNKLVEIFNQRFWSSPVNLHFHMATRDYLHIMDENGVDIAQALILRHFYISFLTSCSDRTLFYVSENPEQSIQNLISIINSPEIQPENAAQYINDAQSSLEALDMRDQQHKTIVALCAWMALLGHYLVYSKEHISEIHQKIKQCFSTSESYFSELNNMWHKYETLEPFARKAIIEAKEADGSHLYIKSLHESGVRLFSSSSAALPRDDISKTLWLLVAFRFFNAIKKGLLEQKKRRSSRRSSERSSATPMIFLSEDDSSEKEKCIVEILSIILNHCPLSPLQRNEIYQSIGNVLSNPKILTFALQQYLLQWERESDQTKRSEILLDVNNFVFSNVEIQTSTLYQKIDRLRTKLECIFFLVNNSKEHFFIPYLMEDLFAQFIVNYSSLFDEVHLVSGHVIETWIFCKKLVDEIGDKVDKKDVYHDFSVAWNDIESRLYNRVPVIDQVYDLILKSEIYIQLRNAGFKIQSSLACITHFLNQKMGVAFILEENIEAFLFILAPRGAQNSKQQRKLLVFFMNKVADIKLLGNVLCVQVKSEVTSSQVLAISHDWEKTYKARIANGQIPAEEYKVIFFYKPSSWLNPFAKREVLRCVEVYRSRRDNILLHDCFVSDERYPNQRNQSSLVSRAAANLFVPKNNGEAIVTLVGNIEYKSDVLLRPLIYPEFFVLVLQGIENSMRFRERSPATSLEPISVEFLKSNYAQDDPRALLHCDDNALIGLFVLGLVYQVLEEEEKKTPQASTWWMINLPRFFCHPNGQRNVEKLAIFGIKGSGMLREFYGLDVKFDPVEKPLKQLDDELNALRLEDKSRFPKLFRDNKRQRAYCEFYNTRYNQTFSSSRVSVSPPSSAEQVSAAANDDFMSGAHKGLS